MPVTLNEYISKAIKSFPNDEDGFDGFLNRFFDGKDSDGKVLKIELSEAVIASFNFGGFIDAIQKDITHLFLETHTPEEFEAFQENPDPAELLDLTKKGMPQLEEWRQQLKRAIRAYLFESENVLIQALEKSGLVQRLAEYYQAKGGIEYVKEMLVNAFCVGYFNTTRTSDDDMLKSFVYIERSLSKEYAEALVSAGCLYVTQKNLEDPTKLPPVASIEAIPASTPPLVPSPGESAASDGYESEDSQGESRQTAQSEVFDDDVTSKDSQVVKRRTVTFKDEDMVHVFEPSNINAFESVLNGEYNLLCSILGNKADKDPTQSETNQNLKILVKQFIEDICDPEIKDKQGIYDNFVQNSLIKPHVKAPKSRLSKCIKRIVIISLILIGGLAAAMIAAMITAPSGPGSVFAGGVTFAAVTNAMAGFFGLSGGALWATVGTTAFTGQVIATTGGALLSPTIAAIKATYSFFKPSVAKPINRILENVREKEALQHNSSVVESA